jgi:transposase, IS30 family
VFMAFFTPEKRIQLETLRQAGMRAASELASQLRCCSRTVERELARCAGKRYNAYCAGLDRQKRAARSAANGVVKAQDELLMQLYGLFDEPLRLSPEGVSLMLCRLPRAGGKPRLSLSTPAIYAWLKRERMNDPSCVLWRGRSGMRSSTRHGAKGSDKGWAAQVQSISERTDRANLRLERNHLECDTLWGRQRDDNRLLVIIDRKSRYVRLGTFKKTAVATAMGAKALLKGSHFKTLTCDRGGEFARLPQFFKDKLFVCHAYRADERGSCENVNRWLREYFPRGVSMDNYSDDYVAQVQDLINHRPRKILNGLTPYEIHFAPPRSPTVRT